MPGEHPLIKGHLVPKPISRRKKSIRIFVQRKRLSAGSLSKSSSSKSNSIEQLTSIIEKKLNRNKKNKNIIIVNYKPVFVRSRERKSTPVNDKSPTPTTTTTNSDPPKPNQFSDHKSVPYDVPDVEDPLMFIEMMYQQLFTEDGQLRNGTEPTVLANRVKQIVTQSRRNSMVHRDSLSSNPYQHKRSSLSSSPRFLRHTFNEDEEPQTFLSRNRTANASRRSSKQSNIDHGDHHQQQLHAFLNSYYHQQKRTSTNYSTIDDTDNEDLDTFSDLNSYRKNIRYSPPASIDEDPTDSKLLSSSGYQSLKSPSPTKFHKPTETNSRCCPNCTQTTILTPSTTSSSLSINLIQPIREIFMKYLNFILISKNVLLVPLLIFLLRQRSMHIGN